VVGITSAEIKRGLLTKAYIEKIIGQNQP